MRGNDINGGQKYSCCSKKDQARRCNCLLKIITAVFAVGFVVSIFFTISAFATANLFKIQNAELGELSTTAEGTIISFDESNIVSDVTFHKLNDSAKYTITLKNTDDNNHIIESVTDDSENPYISYEYEQHQGEQINAGANFVFVVTARYTTATSDISQRAQVSNVKFLIHFMDIEEAIPININPKTSDNLLFSVSLLIISAVGLMIIGATFIKKHKKADKFIAAGIIAVAAIAATTTVKAATIEINSFTFSNNFSLKDKLIVTYEDSAGNSHGMIVDFNESVTIGDQEKDGYTFAGWEDETGTSIDLTQPITDDITIKPVFTKNNYSVIFDKNQGDGSMANLPMFYGEPKQLTKNAFTRTGYAFTGWNTNAGGDGISYADEQEVNDLTKEKGGSVTLYAQWTPIHYVISFNGNGATDGTMNSISAEYDKEIQLPTSSFARTGYTQNGWKNGTASIVDQATVRNLADLEGATVTLDAVWTANTNTRYTVIHKKMHISGEGYFEADRDNLTGTTGTEVTPDRKEYTGFTAPSAQTKKILGDNSTEFIYEYARNKYHFEVTDRTYITNDSDADGDYYYESAVTITAEERPGYEFEWSDGSKSYTRTITIGTEAISLTPNYTEVQKADYTITHEKQKLDGSFKLVETETKKGTVGQEVSPAPKQYDGFETPQKQTKTVTADGSTSINYQYNRKQFTVRFDGQGGTNPADRTRKYEETVGALPQTTRANFEFAGWFTDTSFTTQITGNETVLADTTYYAKWIEGGQFPVVWSEDDSYEFTGNNYLDTGIALYDNTNYDKDYEIYFEIEEYGEQVDEKGNTVGQATLMNESYEDPSVNWPGIIVRRRSTSTTNMEITETISGAKVAKDTVINETEYFRITRISGVVYFETNTIPRTMLQNLNDLQRQEFDTTTWFGASSKKDGTPFRFFRGKLKNMYIKLGKYSDIEIHRIKFNANGGEGVMPDQLIAKTERSIKIAKNNFHKDLYDFTKWTTNADGTGAQYSDESAIDGSTLSDDLTLYAQWSRHFYTISYNLDGGTLENNNPTSYNEDSSAITLNNPSKTGYDFIGWTGSNGDEPQMEVTIVAGSEGDREYTANYNRKEYAITFNPNGGVLGTDEAERIVLGGDPLGELPTPTRDEYIFQGWYQGMEDGARVTDQTVPSASITYYAHWGTAQSLYLSVKTAAENHEDADTWTGEVDDTLGETITTDIYYYKNENPSNNVVFANYCWQIVRTTSTGGVKLIYNGQPNNGRCNETDGTKRIIGKSSYNGDYGNIFPGYMTGERISMNRDWPAANAKFGASFTYSNGIYTLVDAVDTIDEDHRFSCVNEQISCDALRYQTGSIDDRTGYTLVELKNVSTIEEATDALRDNIIDSKAKKAVENWYRNKLVPYTSSIEDTVYCSNRNMSDSTTALSDGYSFTEGQSNEINLTCSNAKDRMSINNNVARITYPVGLITRPEILLGKSQENTYQAPSDNYFLNIGERYWTMTPISGSTGGFNTFINMMNKDGKVNSGSTSGENIGDIGIRPMISLKDNTLFDYGDGSKENPYYINTHTEVAKVTFDENQAEDTADSIVVEKGRSIGPLPVVNRRGYNLRGWFIDGNENNRLTENTIVNDDINVVAIWDEQKFHSDSWETVIENAYNNNLDDYNIGDYKEITLKTYGTVFVRIANKSTERECKIVNYSQTACGFVLEFDEVLYTKSYLDSREQQYFITKEFYDNMPDLVKNSIIETRVGEWDDTSKAIVFKQQKMYEPSVTELLGHGDRRYAIDRIANRTSQLDYYEQKGVNSLYSEGAAKYNRSKTTTSDWAYYQWLYRQTQETGYTVRRTGGWHTCSSTDCTGFAPLFRLGREYTVNYEPNGGTASFSSIKVEDGGILGELPTATRDGYDFVGWFADQDFMEQVDSSYNPQSDMTIYAKWSERKFHSDSWDTIVQNVHNDTTDDYEIGDIKEIEMDRNDDGVNETYKIRLINKTTPNECSQEGYSQTACGFVLEFYTTAGQSIYSNQYTGSWRDSDLRAYMNNTIYEKLPKEVKDVVLDTYVISGHSNNETENFITEDKLYALNYIEVGDTTSLETDTSSSASRVEDYYASPDMTLQKEGTTAWWLRSSSTTYNNYATAVYQNKTAIRPKYNNASATPAFRIEQFNTLRLDAKGGQVAKDYKQILVGEAIGSLLTPTREGYDFSGWYNDEEYTSEVDENEVINSDKTIYAKWTARHYTLTFDSRGGTDVPSMDIVYDQPIGALPENPTKQDHTFVEWFVNNDEKITPNYIAKGDMKAYAKWSYQADITFNANGGTFSDQGQQRVATYTIKDGIGQKIARTSNIDNSGIANGAYSNSLNQTTTIAFPGSPQLDIEIWYGTENSYDWVAIYPKDVTPSSSNANSATISGGALSGTETRTTDKPSDNSSYHRTYRVEDDTVKFFFHSDGSIAYYGYYAIITGEDKIIDNIANYEEPTRAGARFAGWYTGPECTDDQAYDKDNAREAMTLYAKWTYDITFKYNDDSTSDTTKTVKAGDSIGAMPQPTRDDYLFLGWYDSAAGDGDYILEDYIPTSHKTLYAKWGEQTIYNLALSDTSKGTTKRLEKPIIDSIDENDNNQSVYYYSNPNKRFVFGDQCWRYLRTTTDGGTKFQYVGKYEDGQCIAAADNNSIGLYQFNDENNPGYMYNKPIDNTAEELVKTDGDTVRWAKSVEFENGSYRLIDTVEERDDEHRYACSFGAFNYCSEVRFYPTTGNTYYMLKGQNNTKQIIDDFTTNNVNVKDSNMKTVLENWYRDNLINYDQYINKNTIYCNDRRIESYGSFGDPSLNSLATYKNSVDRACTRTIDKFSVNNPEAPLRYGIALATNDEFNLMIGNQGSGTQAYLTPGITLTSIYYSYGWQSGSYGAGSTKDKYYVRPVITLVKNMHYTVEKIGTNTLYFVTATPAEKEQYEIAFVDPTESNRKTSKIINSGDKVGELPQLSSNGKTFDGWYTDANYTTKVDSNTIPNGHTTYYAKWESSKLNEHIALLYANGNTNITKFNGRATDTMDNSLATKDVLYYTGSETDEAKVNNHVIIGNVCWRIIRTTNSGGTKIIYDGLADENSTCQNTGESTIIPGGKINFQPKELNFAGAGYMYNRYYLSMDSERISDRDSYANTYSESYEYYDGAYHLTGDIRTRADNDHQYSCPNGTSTVCSTVRYYYGMNANYLRYYNLQNGMSYKDIIDDMLGANDVNANDSKAKSTVDNWFAGSMNQYNYLLEDAIFCSDRTLNYYRKATPFYTYVQSGKIVDDVNALTKLNGFRRNYPNFDGGTTGKSYSILTCAQKTDKFAVANESAKLRYPVGLITFDELYLIGAKSWLKTGVDYWTMTPSHYSFQSLDMGHLYLSSDGNIYDSQSYRDSNDFKHGIRPVVSLKYDTEFVSGDGSAEHPYVIDTN